MTACDRSLTRASMAMAWPASLASSARGCPEQTSHQTLWRRGDWRISLHSLPSAHSRVSDELRKLYCKSGFFGLCSTVFVAGVFLHRTRCVVFVRSSFGPGDTRKGTRRTATSTPMNTPSLVLADGGGTGALGTIATTAELSTTGLLTDVTAVGWTLL